MATKPVEFDPSKPFDLVKPPAPEPKFDPSKPFDAVVPEPEFDPNKPFEAVVNPDVIGEHDAEDPYDVGFLRKEAWLKKKANETILDQASELGSGVVHAIPSILSSIGKVAVAGEKIKSMDPRTVADLGTALLPAEARDAIRKPIYQIGDFIDLHNPIARAVNGTKAAVREGVNTMPEGVLKSIAKGEMEVMDAKPSPGALPEAVAQIGVLGKDIVRGAYRVGQKMAADKPEADDIRYNAALESYRTANRRAAGQSIIGDAAEYLGIPRKRIDELTDQEQAFALGLVANPEVAFTKLGSVALRAVRGGRVAEAMELLKANKMADEVIQSGYKAMDEAGAASRTQKVMSTVVDTAKNPAAAAVGAVQKAAGAGAAVSEKIGKFATEHPTLTNVAGAAIYPVIKAAEGDFHPSDILAGIVGKAGVSAILRRKQLFNKSEEIAADAAANSGALRTAEDVIGGTAQGMRVGGDGARGLGIAAKRVGSEKAQRILTLARGIDLTGQTATVGEKVAAKLVRGFVKGGGYANDAIKAGTTGWLMGYFAGSGDTETANSMAGGGIVIGLGAHGVANSFTTKHDPAVDMSYIKERLKTATPQEAAMMKDMMKRGANPQSLASILEESDSVKGKADVVYHTDAKTYGAEIQKMKPEGEKVSDQEVNSSGFFVPGKESANGRPQIHVNLTPNRSGRPIEATAHEISHFFDQIQAYIGTDKKGRPIGEDHFLAPHMEWAEAVAGSMGQDQRLPIEERNKKVEADAVTPGTAARGRFTKEELLQILSEYNTRLGRDIPKDTNGVPVLTPAAIRSVMGELYADTGGQFFRRAIDVSGSKGKLDYAKKVLSMSDEQLQSLIDHSDTSSVLFMDPKTGEPLKSNAAMERAYAKIVLAYEGFTKPVMEGKSDLSGHITVRPEEQITTGKQVRDAVRQAEYTGDQASIDAANAKLDDLIKSGIYHTLPKTPQQIRTEAALRAKRLNGGKTPTEQQITESMPFIPEREMATAKNLPMLPEDVPALVTNLDKAKRDAKVAQSFTDALLKVPAGTEEDGLVPQPGKDGIYFTGTHINEEQMAALMALDSSVNPAGMKRLLAQLNNMMRTRPGGAMSAVYFPASKGRGNLVKSFRVFSPTSFFISGKSNPSIIAFDRTAFNKAIQREINLEIESGTPSKYLEPFKEPTDTDPMQKVDRFLKKVFEYTENHAAGRPGATNLDPDVTKASDMRDALNGFFGISKQDVNPMASENNFYRMFRIDRVMDLKGRPDLDRMVIQYGDQGVRHQEINFMPKVEPSEVVIPTEAIPGAEKPELKKWMSQIGGPEERANLTNAMAKMLRDNKDTIEKDVGLKIEIPTELKSGYWEGDSNPTVPITIAEKNIETKTGELDPSAREKIERLAAVLGDALHQDAMAYTHMVQSGLVKNPNDNSYRFIPHGKYEASELRDLGSELDMAFTTGGHALIQEPSGAIRILNTTEFSSDPALRVPHQEFGLQINQILNKLQQKGELHEWQNDGLYIPRADFGTKIGSPERGVREVDGVSPPGSPGVQSGSDVLRAQASEIFKGFAEKAKVDFMPEVDLPITYSKNKKGTDAIGKDGEPIVAKIPYDILDAPLVGDLVKPVDKTAADTLEADRFPYLNFIERKRISQAKDSGAVDKFAEALAGEYKKVADIPEIAAGKGWYSGMREKLTKALGDNVEIFNQFLGATSAKTPVEDNFVQAVDALEQYKSGKFQRHIDSYLEARKLLAEGKLQSELAKRGIVKEKKAEGMTDAAALAKWIKSQKILPLKSNGMKFNSNSSQVLNVLAGTWLENVAAPKTPNFAGNLSGRTLQATIDVWAGRLMRRLGYDVGDGKPWRIQPQSEGGVSNQDFALSQLVFEKAAKEVGVNPDDLQAIMWYSEKHVWEERGWSNKFGAKKSSFDDAFHIFFPVGQPPRSRADGAKILQFLRTENRMNDANNQIRNNTNPNELKKYSAKFRAEQKLLRAQARNKVVAEYLKDRGGEPLFTADAGSESADGVRPGSASGVGQTGERRGGLGGVEVAQKRPKTLEGAQTPVMTPVLMGSR